MTVIGGPDIVEGGLVLYLDAANPDSYPGSGTTWKDLSGNGYDFTLNNTPTFASHKNTPCFTFSGANDYATRVGSISHDISTACTLTITLASNSNNNFGSCSRLFSINNGSSSNNDYSTYFTLASCNQSKYGLWYANSPAGLYSTSNLKTVNDDYKILTFKWNSSNSAYVYVNGVQENSANTGAGFTYTAIQRMTVGMNSSLTQENANVRVANVIMHDKVLSPEEIQQNYNAIKSRFDLK